MDRSLLIALIVVSVLGVGVLAIGFAVADQVDEDDAGPYELEELRSDGLQPGDAPDSVRPLGDDGALWLQYRPTGLVSAFEYDSEDEYPLLDRGAEINRDQIYLWSSRGWSAEPLEAELVVVYWREGSIETANGTQTAAVDQEVERHSIQLGSGYDVTEIDLRPRFDDPAEVTMWLDLEPEEVRWRFTHHSTATEQQAPISTFGDLYRWLALNILGPLVVLLGISIGGVRLSLRRTKAGPGKGVFWWGFVGFWALLGAGALAYWYVASLLVAAPYVIAAAIALVVAIVLLETEDDVETWEFVSLRTTDTTGPTGEEIKDAVAGDVERKRVATRSDKPAVVPRGIRPWIARLLGGATTLRGYDNLNGEIKVGLGDVDRLVFVEEHDEPYVDQLVDHDPEGLSIELEDPRDRPIPWLISIVAATTVGAGAIAIWGSTSAAMAVASPMLLIGATRAQDGEARINPAPGQARSIFATAMYLDTQSSIYQTLDDVVEALVEERNRDQEIVEYLEETEDLSLIKRAHKRDERDLGALISGEDVEAKEGDQ